MNKQKAPRNRTVTLSEDEIPVLKSQILSKSQVNFGNFVNSTINSDILEALPLLPDEFADLIIIDPPYNLTKNFNGFTFSQRSIESYDEYLASWFPLV
ncbi:MAG: hypothetical protein SOT81_05320 [Treponema sp.]|nr:hypothetical protein [Treponema sp.]